MKLLPVILLAFSLGLFPAAAGDPSAEALPDETGRQKFRERSRILVDLDGDGTTDTLLSNPASAGNSGVDWSVYLHRQGDFRRIGNLWAHPQAISFERIPGESHTGILARVWVYVRGGAGEGSFGYCLVKEDSVEELKAIRIYPGGGKESIGEKLYAAAFRESPVPFQVEQSRTTEAGEVSWHAVPE